MNVCLCECIGRVAWEGCEVREEREEVWTVRGFPVSPDAISAEISARVSKRRGRKGERKGEKGRERI